MSVEQSIAELRSYLPRAAARDEGTSGWSIGMHLHHCCLVMVGIHQALEQSTAAPGSAPRRSRLGALLLRFGRIPRGRARAPESVAPRADIGDAELAELLDQAEDALASARRLDAGVWFKHFAFGVLDRDLSLRFLEVHNRHHLRIVADIADAIDH